MSVSKLSRGNSSSFLTSSAGSYREGWRGELLPFSRLSDVVDGGPCI